MIKRVADVTLERYHLNELPPRERARIELLSLNDGATRLRIAALRQSNAECAARFPARDLARGIVERLAANHPPSSRSKFIRPLLGVVVAAAVMTLAVWPSLRSSDEREKGSAAGLSIYRDTPSGSELLADNAIARSGDRIRVGYRLAEHGYAVIVSIDGRGVISQHLPANGSQSVEIASDTAQLVDASFELDDAPDIERFFLFSSPSPFTTDTAIGAVRKSGGRANHLTLPSSMRVVTFSLRKEP